MKIDSTEKTRNIFSESDALSIDNAFHTFRKKVFGSKEHSPAYIIVTTILCTFLCYFYDMIYGLGCPDTLSEGVFIFRNANYATEQARWMIRFVNQFFSRNIVIPFIVIVLYCTCIGISVYIICRMTKLFKPLTQVLLTAMMVTFPIILHHLAFYYMGLAFCLSFLLTVIGVALIRKRKIYSVIIGTLCFLVMLGLYQAYVGAISALCLVLFIYDMINEQKLSSAFKNLLLCAASGVIACLVNVPVYKLMIRLYHLDSSNRVDQFSISSIFKHLGFSLKHSYIWFFSFFKEKVLARSYLYTILFLIILILSVSLVIILIKKKQIIRACLIIVSIIVLPLAMNLLLILIPENGMRDMLRYQYVYIYLLLFLLHDKLPTSLINVFLKYISSFAIVLMLIGNIITGTCTAYMYKFSYDHYKQAFLQAMSDVNKLDGYTLNETTILTGGTPSLQEIYERNQLIFKYAAGEGGPVFYYGLFGSTTCRKSFFYDFMGIDAGDLSYDEFLNIIQSKEYKEMPLWPADGSIKMIDGIAVIKFENEPPAN